MALNQMVTGPQANGDSATVTARAGRQGDSIVSELHGRFYEQNYRGNLYGGGMTLTAITNAIWTTGTTDATAKPIIGLYNPLTSGVNAVILQAYLGITLTAATNTGAGPFVWSVSTGESAISTGTTPFNRKTLAASGSAVKDMCGIALTGKVNSLAVRCASALGGGSSANFSFVGTAVGQATTFAAYVENIDGAIIVPPGGVLALQATTTPVAHSAASGLLWEEVPI